MSFFNDFLEHFKIEQTGENVSISIILGVGLVIVGKCKVLDFSDKNILIKLKQNKLLIAGDGLNIDTMSKGEIVVSGKLLKLELE